jgi:NAD(P)-dependent dehydrogenase (short-subunit alcohol dehydrogenase family)
VNATLKTAVVTGATDGIGRATAVRLARGGWHVVVVGRSQERCADAVRGITTSGGSAEAAVTDLAVMADVRRVAESVCAKHSRLDALVLNANAITQERRLTSDGFEANLAVGYLGRALLQWRLDPLLARTPGSQVLTVVGLDHVRMDLADPQLARHYTARKALMRWQWAVQVLARESNRRGACPVNVYMPGLVKTKILANEPQPMRALVQLANLFFGISVERSAEELVSVLERVAAGGIRDGYFSRTALKPPRDLRSTPEDGGELWSWTESTLQPWL